MSASANYFIHTNKSVALVRAYISGYNFGKAKADQLKSSDRYMLEKLLDMYQEAQLKGEKKLIEGKSIPPIVIGTKDLAEASHIGLATARKNLKRLVAASLIKVQPASGKRLQIQILRSVLYIQLGLISEETLEDFPSSYSFTFK